MGPSNARLALDLVKVEYSFAHVQLLLSIFDLDKTNPEREWFLGTLLICGNCGYNRLSFLCGDVFLDF